MNIEILSAEISEKIADCIFEFVKKNKNIKNNEMAKILSNSLSIISCYIADQTIKEKYPEHKIKFINDIFDKYKFFLD